MRNITLATALLLATLTSQSPAPVAAPATTAVQLIYQLPMDLLQRSLRDRPDQDLEGLLAETVASVQTRVPDGVKVTRQGATGFVVVVPTTDPAEIARVRRFVETVGKLEMRIVAHAEAAAADPQFDLAAEKVRLTTWLEAGGRERVLANPEALKAFHEDKQHGPLAAGKLRWFVHRIEPDAVETGQWRLVRFAGMPGFADACVPLHGNADWNHGVIPGPIQARPAAQRCLLELVAIDMQEFHFANGDIDPASVKIVASQASAHALDYRIVGRRTAEYADWSEKHIDHFAAVLWNDEVVMAPRFVTRIPGRGQIAGPFTKAQLEVLQAVLKAPPLAAKPELMSQQQLPK